MNSKKNRVAILQCGDVLDKFQSEFSNYPEMVIKFLSNKFVGYHFDVFDLQKQCYPDNLSHYDLYVITGSKNSVYENEIWIKKAIGYVQTLAKGKNKIAGICFGHQLIAMALKGRVEKSGKGWGVGVAVNRVLHKTKWMKSAKHSLNILVSHQDQVTALPEGADILIESTFCPFFMVQWRENILSIQGHPEWVKGYSAALMEERRGIIPDQTINAGLASLSIPTDNELVAEWFYDFMLT